jgi:hypothetical protein
MSDMPQDVALYPTTYTIILKNIYFLIVQKNRLCLKIYHVRVESTIVIYIGIKNAESLGTLLTYLYKMDRGYSSFTKARSQPS